MLHRHASALLCGNGFRLLVRQTVCSHYQRGSHWTDFREIWCGGLYERMSGVPRFGSDGTSMSAPLHEDLIAVFFLFLVMWGHHESNLFAWSSVSLLGWLIRYKYYANALCLSCLTLIYSWIEFFALFLPCLVLHGKLVSVRVSLYSSYVVTGH
jgi:hypothetical protein